MKGAIGASRSPRSVSGERRRPPPPSRTGSLLFSDWRPSVWRERLRPPTAAGRRLQGLSHLEWSFYLRGGLFFLKPRRRLPTSPIPTLSACNNTPPRPRRSERRARRRRVHAEPLRSARPARLFFFEPRIGPASRQPLTGGAAPRTWRSRRPARVRRRRTRAVAYLPRASLASSCLRPDGGGRSSASRRSRSWTRRARMPPASAMRLARGLLLKKIVHVRRPQCFTRCRRCWPTWYASSTAADSGLTFRRVGTLSNPKH